MKNAMSIILVVLLAAGCGKREEAQKEDSLRVVPIEQLREKPLKADYVSLSAEQFKKITAQVAQGAELDTTSFVSYTEGLLISESPDRQSYWVHPPKSPFTSDIRMAAAVLKGNLTFFGICPNDEPNCPGWPDKMEGLPEICDYPPCFEGVDVGGGFIPFPRPACTALLNSTDWYAACSQRAPCPGTQVCKSRYRYIENRFSNRLQVVTDRVRFLFIWCKCECQ